jgi:hypothetical protein
MPTADQKRAEYGQERFPTENAPTIPMGFTSPPPHGLDVAKLFPDPSDRQERQSPQNMPMTEFRKLMR